MIRYKQAAFCYEELLLSQPTIPLHHLAYADVSRKMNSAYSIDIVNGRLRHSLMNAITTYYYEAVDLHKHFKFYYKRTYLGLAYRNRELCLSCHCTFDWQYTHLNLVVFECLHAWNFPPEKSPMLSVYVSWVILVI